MTSRRLRWPVLLVTFLGCIGLLSFFVYRQPSRSLPRGQLLDQEWGNADTLLLWGNAKGSAPKPWVFNADDYQLLPVSKEPSAATALPRHGGFFVLDDEPSDAPAGGILFYRWNQGRLRSVPVKLPSQRILWDDWEGATTSRTHVYFATSHAKPDADRCQLCRFRRDAVVSTRDRLILPASLKCRGGVGQRKRMLDALRRASRRHGFSLPAGFENLPPKQGGLDLEGIAWDAKHDVLLAGLRGPLAKLGRERLAILLELRWEGEKTSVRFRSLVDLGGRGVRGMTTLPSGEILLLTGPQGNTGAFDLYKSTTKRALRLPVTRLTSPSFPWIQKGRPFKPEAVVWFSRRLFLFSDSGEWDGEPAHFLVLPRERQTP